MPTIQELTKRLTNFYWSPEHPSHYVLKTSTGVLGLGGIAHHDYAAFNLTWAVTRGVLNTPAEHIAACKFFNDAHTFVHQVRIQGELLETWLTLLTQKQFANLVQQNRDELGKHELAVLEACL